MSLPGEVLREVEGKDWLVRRFGVIEEVNLQGAIRFRVTVWDEGRNPFLVQWFNDVGPASDFLGRLKSDGAGRLLEVED